MRGNNNETKTNMNERERNRINEQTAMQGEHPDELGNLSVRRLSMESLAALERIGSPFAADFAAAINGEAAEKHNTTAQDLLLFVWVHAADPDEVLRVTLKCSPVFSAPAVEAATLFARERMTDPATFAAAVQLITATGEQLQAASFQAHAPDMGGRKTRHAKKKG